MGRLEGKVAIVTGASQGIGEGIARVFAREGAAVVLTARSDRIYQKAKEIQAAGQRAVAMKMDVIKPDEVQKTARRVLEQFGKVDILVNNAGIYFKAPFVEMTEELWDRIFDINVKGVFYCTKAVLPSMIERRSGKIINISSVTGPMVSSPRYTAYSASKGAISAFTRALALEVAEYGINVNTICPGDIYTPGYERSWKRQGLSSEEIAEEKKRVVQSIPFKRFGSPEEVGQLALFLASEESNFITGTEIVFDGGSIIQ